MVNLPSNCYVVSLSRISHTFLDGFSYNVSANVSNFQVWNVLKACWKTILKISRHVKNCVENFKTCWKLCSKFEGVLKTILKISRCIENYIMVKYEKKFQGVLKLKPAIPVFSQIIYNSSRMCTIRCSIHLPGGIVSAHEVCLPRVGVCPQGGCLPWGVGREGGGACQGGCTPPPCGQNSQHTLVKRLPFRNYVFGR